MYVDMILELITRASNCAEPMKRMADSVNNIRVSDELINAMKFNEVIEQNK